MSRRRLALRVASLAAAVGLPLAALPAGAEPLPQLFDVVGDKAFTIAVDDPGVVRRQTAVLDVSMLDSFYPPGRLRLDLFGDQRTAHFDERQETLVGPVLLGQAEGADGELIEESLVTVAWSGGTATVDVILPDSRFSLHPTPGGEIVLDAIDESLRAPGADPIPAFGLASTRPPAYVAKDSGSRIDVLVVYTGLARERAGGLNPLLQRIATGAAELNRAFADGGVATSIRLVHTAEIPYVERDWDIGFDVEALQRKGDGLLDDAHIWRDQWGADLVAMIGENSTGACGIAYLMDGATNAAFEAEAFSYTARVCLNASYTFGHELAHNMGSNHARVDPIKEGAYNFSYGWKDPERRFRTVMAYQCSGGGCPQLLRFSTPRQTWNGAVMGDLENDNVRSLQGVRPTVANFRQERRVNRGRIELVERSTTVAENGGSLTVRVRRVAGSGGDVSVGYRTVDGSARAGSDFTTVTGRLSWSNGVADAKTFEVPIVDDAVEEAAETFRIELFDVEGGASLGLTSATVTIDDDDEEPFEPFICQEDATTLCLQGGRFQVRLSFRANGESGEGQVVPEAAGSNDSGLLYLFDEANWEMLVKVLDGCSINGRFWVFSAATTDVGYTLDVVDSRTGVTRQFTNPAGRAAQALVDTNAFATCDG